MTDLTPLLNSLLQKHNAHLRSHPRTRSHTTDEFLKEAYRINAHILSLHTYLRQIRTPYLSTASSPHRSIQKHHTQQHLTPSQRASIDASTQSLLRDLNASIHQLSDVETLRHNTALTILKKKHGHGGLAGAVGRWAAGGTGADEGKGEEEKEGEDREAMTRAWRESVIWYLRKKLGEAGEMQRGMMERRVEREVERGRSVLYLAKGAMEESAGRGGMATMNGGVEGPAKRMGNGRVTGDDDNGSREIEQQLSPEQLQIFAQENNELLRHYEDTLDQVRTAETSLLSISELQTTLAANLDTQSSQISQLVQDALSTTENVGGGNKQLKKAAERKSTARMVFWATVGLCVGLVGWDLVF